MIHETSPVCLHHDAQVRMTLRTMHSDLSQPDLLVGLFECPECGDQRRLPLVTAAASGAETREAEVA